MAEFIVGQDLKKGDKAFISESNFKVWKYEPLTLVKPKWPDKISCCTSNSVEMCCMMVDKINQIIDYLTWLMKDIEK